MTVSLKLNGIEVPVKHFTFKGGEEQVHIDTKFAPKGSIGFVEITSKIKNSCDVMTLLMLVDACYRLENLHHHAEMTLNIPYVPYARQDRVMQSGEALSSRVFADLINGLGFDKVVIDDPHSHVISGMINKVRIRSQEELASSFHDVLTGKNATIIAPDAGARKKAQKVAERFCMPIIEAGKVRNVETGEITGTAVYGDVEGRKCLIVDDIADGGRTFIALAQALKEKGAKRVILYVTHGIFSFGKQVILDGGVDEIYAYHDWTENF